MGKNAPLVLESWRAGSQTDDSICHPFPLFLIVVDILNTIMRRMDHA